jgi:hypothetical protein
MAIFNFFDTRTDEEKAVHDKLSDDQFELV